ncbi:MAG: PIN domain-containing protein [Caulobacteraceae bacterium]
MAFLLDTNVAIDLRDSVRSTMDRVAALEGAVLLSIISRAELEGGVYRDPSLAALRRRRVDALLAALSIVPFTDASADAYRAIVETRGFSRRKIVDRMIAAQALVHRATLVTTNPEDFRDVPGLDLLAW